MATSQNLPEQLHIGSDKHWKAIAHPHRLAIIRLLRQKAMTNEELAKALGVKSGKLYFHTKLLLDSGLIVLAGTEQKGPITQKIYRAAAKRFLACDPVEPQQPRDKRNVADSILELFQATRTEFPELMKSEHCLIDQNLLLLKPAKAMGIKKKLEKLADEALAAKSTDADAIPLAMSILLYRLPESHKPKKGKKK